MCEGVHFNKTAGLQLTISLKNVLHHKFQGFSTQVENTCFEENLSMTGSEFFDP